MSLMIKICQTVSNISKYLWLVNFTSFIIRIFGGTLLFGPTVRKPVVSRLVLSGSRIRRVEQFHCIALFCSTRRHFYYVWRLRLLGCPRLILLHVQQFGKFKKLFVKSQWVKLLTFVIWLYEPHYFLSILTQCNKWEEFCFKEKKNAWIIALWPVHQMVARNYKYKFEKKVFWWIIGQLIICMWGKNLATPPLLPLPTCLLQCC